MGDPLALHHSDYHAHLYHLERSGGLVGDWRIEKVLGRGGYGAVARARRSYGGVGALKLTHPAICDKEVDILRQFGGESIPRLLDGPIELPGLGYPASCYVMELADETLAQHFEGDEIRPVPQVRWCSLADQDFYRQLYAWLPYRLREQKALAVASAVLVSLETARSHLHGDICPSNVLLFSSGNALQVKLADWGNARIYLQENVDYTLIGGKELWCPPRTRAHSLSRPGAKPEPPTDKIDIYGLGALVCWMLTGTVPNQLARWEVRDDPGSHRGLPLEQVGRAWHEFLVATTRADRERRADHAEATRLLAEARSRLRRNRPIAEPRVPVQPSPDPAPTRPLRPVATEVRPAAPSAPDPPSPVRATPARVPSTSRPHGRRRRDSLISAIAAVAVVFVLAASDTATTTDRPGATPPPGQQAGRLLCDQPDLLCTAQVLEPLVAGTKLVWPDGLKPVVRAWHRGSFSRLELVDDESSIWGGRWQDKHLDDAAVVRLDFLNTTQETKPVTAAGLGLIVSVDDELALLPTGALPAYVLGAQTPDMLLAWLPPMPSATRTWGHLPKLLPAAPLPPGPGGANGYPFTAVFDLSALPGSRIVGLGGGRLLEADGTEKVVLTSLHAAPLWPDERVDTKDVFDNHSTTDLVRGGCYVGLYDAGLEYSRVDCDQPHTIEVVDTPQLPPAARGSDELALTAASELCAQARLTVYGLDSSLNATPRTRWPGAWSRDRGDFSVDCLAVSLNSVPLWLGPKTPAAIESDR